MWIIQKTSNLSFFSIVLTVVALISHSSITLAQSVVATNRAVIGAVRLPAENFGGKWIYEGTTEIEGKIYRAIHQLDLYQNENRVCGCWHKIGAPVERVEYRVLAGWVVGNVLDFYADSGDVSSLPDEYRAAYPFKPETVERMQKRGEKLYWGVLGRRSRVIANGFPPIDRTRYIENDLVLVRKSTIFDQNACGGDPDAYEWSIYLRACLADQNFNKAPGENK